MRQTALFLLTCALFAGAFCPAAEAKTRRFNASGEVVDVQPLFGSVTIRHSYVKDFSAEGDTEFFVTSPGLVKNVSKGDLVDFAIVDENGDVRIDKIEKTGVAEPARKVTAGQMVQDVIEGTGEVAKGITEPLPPLHDSTKGAVEATTGATEQILQDADTEVKAKF